MFNLRERVEEDLERIRKANLPPADSLPANPPDAYEPHTEESDAQELINSKAEHNTGQPIDTVPQATTVSDEKIGAKDIFAMIIAVFSLILPYLLVMLAVMAFVIILFLRRAIF